MRVLSVAVACLSLVGLSHAGDVRASIKQATNIPAQALEPALKSFARERHLYLIYASQDLSALRTSGAVGEFTADQVLATLLSGTGLTYRYIDDKTVTIIPVVSAQSGLQSAEAAAGSAAEKPTAPDKATDAREAQDKSFWDRFRLAQTDRDVPAEPSSVSKDHSSRQNDKNPQASLEEVVITGTHIRGAGPVGSRVLTLTQSDIERQGFSTIQDVLNSLPQNSQLGSSNLQLSGASNAAALQNQHLNETAGSGVNLRGLGPAATLALLDGHRLAMSGFGATYADISQIPVSAISRIEVLADGASAIYGSDAVGGVVNVVTRGGVAKPEVTARRGFGDGFSTNQVNASFGTSWTGGEAFATYQFRMASNLSYDSRPEITLDRRVHGGGNSASFYGPPGTIVIGGTRYAIPAGQSGIALQPSSLIAGTANYANALHGEDLTPDENLHSFFVSAKQSLMENLELHTELNYNNHEFDRRQSAFATAVNVPRENAFFVTPVPGATSETVYYSFTNELGNIEQHADESAYVTDIGFTYDIPREWQLQFDTSYSRDYYTSLQSNQVNSALLAPLLASSDRNVAINLFGDGSGQNMASLLQTLGYARTRAHSSEFGFNLKANGPLIRLPTGDLKIAIGAERRSQTYGRSAELFTSSVTPTYSSHTSGRDIGAAFVEADIPLIDARMKIPLVRQLSASVAERWEHYSNFGDTDNARIGLEWRPIDALAIRGSYGTSFKAPLLLQVDATNQVFSTFALPARAGTIQSILLQNANPDLRPETATTWTLGGLLTPGAIDGLKVDIEYFNIDYRNQIGTFPLTAALTDPTLAPFVTLNPPLAVINAYFSSPYFSGSPPAASTIGAIVDFRPHNLATAITRGLDIAPSYACKTAAGDFRFDFSATYLFKYATQQISSAPLVSQVNTPYYPSRFRFRGGAGWSNTWVAASVYANYVNPYNNNLVTPVQRVASFTTWDLSASVKLSRFAASKWLDGASLVFSGANVFNARPPYVDVSGAFDPNNGSPIGRVLSLELRKQF